MKSSGSLEIFATARDTAERLSPRPSIVFGPLPEKPGGASILVDAGRRYQEIEGFGGAFTEAAAVTFYKMSPARRAEILKAYFDPRGGHGYRLCRTHINSCDFSLGNYAYTEAEGDTALKHFSIERDRKALIPMIKEALAASGGSFQLFASPWSPPAWMKTTAKMNQGGKLRPEYRQAWADYYCRYIREYAREGIPVWGLTVQNEPEATQPWDSCVWTAEEERDFVRDFLGPTLERAGLSRVKIIIWDHNRDRVFERAKAVYDDPSAARFVWGTGFHWYCGDNFDNVRLVHEVYPDKKLLFTEGCQEGRPRSDDWNIGERYGRSMIADLNRWTVGWVDWNLLLDETGGPNHVGNFCNAPIIADTRNDTLTRQNSYYYIGHFARFIRPGAVRVFCASTHDHLEATAFLNTDGRVAVVVLNRSEKEMPFTLKFNGLDASTASPAHSILTLCFRIV